MYTSSLAEVYAGDYPLGFWQPAQVWGSSLEDMGFSLLAEKAPGGLCGGKTGAYFNYPMKYFPKVRERVYLL